MTKRKPIRRCAVCGTTVQSNVLLKWRRRCDGKVFNICLLCYEDNKVNEDSINNFGSYSGAEVLVEHNEE